MCCANSVIKGGVDQNRENVGNDEEDAQAAYLEAERRERSQEKRRAENQRRLSSYLEPDRGGGGCAGRRGPVGCHPEEDGLNFSACESQHPQQGANAAKARVQISKRQHERGDQRNCRNLVVIVHEKRQQTPSVFWFAWMGSRARDAELASIEHHASRNLCPSASVAAGTSYTGNRVERKPRVWHLRPQR